ncbi:DUF547 domain-containing protein [Muricauda sp. JGD-17]|uniref:DUF547 domain-containing protein n=1 Tax=Flagellimonas ochracea TaxID=2696472 RepID=A0A964TC24_9FLAO|nr:DUF547 domain-containing protein [Allomuricauda ochracea]NAY92102.1 DUF547 domain-containing protein [Allomuricauda ochracea]
MNFISYLFFGLLLIACKGNTENLLAQDHVSLSKPSHTQWNDMLRNYVDDNGNVDYQNIAKHPSQLEDYLTHLAENPPASIWSKNEKLAYFINLYNAATIKLIVDNYPVESIKDIPFRWKKKWIKVGQEVTSLNDIEHKVLRKMNEPRIHFAINCASFSCPKLLNIAFTAENMEALLSKAAEEFINDPKRNRFEMDTAYLSEIFKWFKGDFTGKSSLLGFINSYLKKPIPEDVDIDYLDYDWSLNEAK